MIEGIQINKRVFWRFVTKKVKKLVNHYHILGVIDVLFEEMSNDLKEGKEIKIYNFCTINLIRQPDRMHHHITLKKLVLAKGRKRIKISMPPKIRIRLNKLLDLETTFGNDKK